MIREENLSTKHFNLDSLSFFKSLEDKKLLTKSEELELLKAYRFNGNIEAKKILVEKNLNWIKKVARKNYNENLDIEDLVNSGVTGYLIAIDRYDFTKGTRLNTYATSYIVSYIYAFKRKMMLNTYSITENDRKIFNKIRKLETKYFFLEETLRKEIIASKLNITVEEIDEIKLIFTSSKSLNEIDELGIELHEKIVDENSLFEEEIISDLFLDDIFKSNLLKENEMDILIKRYGLIDGVPKSQYEIEELLNISHQQVSQIEIRALKKLRKSEYFKEIKDEIELKKAIKKLNEIDQNIINLYLGYYSGKRMPKTEKIKLLDIKDVYVYYEIITDIIYKLSENIPNIVYLCNEVCYRNNEKINENSKEENLLRMELSYEIKKLINSYLEKRIFKKEVKDLSLKETIIIILSKENFNNEEICKILNVTEEDINNSIFKYNIKNENRLILKK